MNDYLELFIKQEIIKQIEVERDDKSLEYEFYNMGLIYRADGRAYGSFWNDNKKAYFDVIVKWKKDKLMIGFEICYNECKSKEELSIYHYL